MTEAAIRAYIDSKLAVLETKLGVEAARRELALTKWLAFIVLAGYLPLLFLAISR